MANGYLKIRLFIGTDFKNVNLILVISHFNLHSKPDLQYKGRSEFFVQCDNELKHWSYQSTGVDYLPSQLDAVLQVANSWGLWLVLVMPGASLYFLLSQLDAVLQVANSWGLGLVLVMSGASLYLPVLASPL